MLKKKISSDGTKNTLFFCSRVLSHYSFTFDLRFLYELKHKVRLSKTVCRISDFRIPFAFINVYIFVQQNTWSFLALKHYNSFRNLK